MRKYVAKFIAAYLVCQQHKSETLSPDGLLQPLQLPSQVWSDLSMDFVVGLPKSVGKSVLLVVVDLFSKYAHFLPASHPYMASSIARLFFEHVVRLHVLSETIVSDRDALFTNIF